MKRVIAELGSLPKPLKRDFYELYGDPFDNENEFVRMEIGGKVIHALPFETGDTLYMIKVKRLIRDGKKKILKKHLSLANIEMEKIREHIGRDNGIENISRLEDDGDL